MEAVAVAVATSDVDADFGRGWLREQGLCAALGSIHGNVMYTVETQVASTHSSQLAACVARQGGGKGGEGETGDSGRHRLMLSLLLSLDRKFAMASLTTCNEQERQTEKQMEAKESEPQAATSRHLKIMLQTFWHVAQVRVSEIGPCKRFNSPPAAAAAATRCDARRGDLTAL